MAGGGQPHRPVRLQARADQAARPAVRLRRAVEAFQNGLGPGCGRSGISPLRPMRQDAERGRGPAGHVRRRHRVHPQHGRQDGRAQPGTCLQATGFNRPGFPAMGCWVSYGLGSMNENLPTFVVLPDHRGFASNGTKNWDAAFLPAQHQGTVIYPGTDEPDRRPVPGRPGRLLDAQSDADGIALLAELEPRARRRAARRRAAGSPHPQLRAGRPHAAGRARGARHLQRAGAHLDAVRARPSDGTSFDKEINPLEETDYFGRKCLVARRLLERGVRFVQIWSGNDNGFPAAQLGLARGRRSATTARWPLGMARGAAALIQDLKQRGLLDDTIICGRPSSAACRRSRGQGPRPQPVSSSPTGWPAAASSGGVTYGPSDEWGYKPLDRDRPTTGLRHPRHDPAPAGHRPRKTDRPPQRHRPPVDRRQRKRHP